MTGGPSMVLVTKALKVKPRDWNRVFHVEVFVGGAAPATAAVFSTAFAEAAACLTELAADPAKVGVD